MFRDVPECFGMFRHVPECSVFLVLSTAGFRAGSKAIRYSMNITLESELRLSTGSNKQTLTNRTLKPSWTE